MTDANKPTSGAPEDDWVPIGGAPARKAAPVGPLVEDEAPQQEKVYGVRKRTPAGLISLRVGAIALGLMLLLYIFSDLRDVETPVVNRPFRVGYALLVIPALGILWGLIGLVKREPDDLRRSMLGIMLSLASIGLAYGTVTNVRAKAPAEQSADDRTHLAPKDLNKWREERLHQDTEHK